MRFFKVVLASALGYMIAAVLLFGLFMALVMGLASKAKTEVSITSGSVLNLKLNYPLVDRMQENNPFAALAALDPNAPTPVGLIDLLRSIEYAKTDDHIDGIVLDLTGLESGYGKLTEVRNKLDEFRASGKFVYAYADYYDVKSYFLASVADSVFVNPEGQMLLNGMAAEVAFFSNTLKKLGVDMQVIRHGKFKGAVEPFVRESLSKENKAQIQAYVNSVYDNSIMQMAQSRGMDADKMKADANTLDLRNVEAYASQGYVDMVNYKDQFYSIMKTRMGLEQDDKVELVSISKYLKLVDEDKSGERVAVIYASGDIVPGQGDGTEIAAEDMVKLLSKVRKSDRIKAVVLRIDSRGGSALASDIIWREAKLLAAEKPLIVSMSDVAASGGYYIATAGDTIVADPSTITGSIGVFGMIPNAQRLLNDKLGVNLEYVTTSEYAALGRPDKALRTEEVEYITQIIDEIYESFINKVAQGRDMTVEQVEALAQGRVWTGSMALENGLVDVLGGLETAIDLAAQAAGLETYRVKDYPRKQDPFKQIIERVQGNASMKTQLLSSEYGEYVRWMMEAERMASSQSAQMMMPYSIKVRSFNFR